MSDTRFSAAERAAMKERASELRTAKGAGKKQKEERALLEKIAELPDADRVLAEKLHAVVTEVAPDLDAKTWYGMPAYARDGKIICFFQPQDKFKSRYATLGFNDDAKLDDGDMWPTAFALVEWTDAVDKKVRALVKKAIS